MGTGDVADFADEFDVAADTGVRTAAMAHAAEDAAVLLVNRATALAQLGDYKTVVKDCSRALALLPKPRLKPLMRRALAYENLERYEDAAFDFRAALALDPTARLASEGSMRCAKMGITEKMMIAKDQALIERHAAEIGYLAGPVKPCLPQFEIRGKAG